MILSPTLLKNRRIFSGCKYQTFREGTSTWINQDMFNHPKTQNDAELSEEEQEINEALIVPTDLSTSSHTIRVTRPAPPRNFVLPRALTTEK
ncbi:hypothetical protein MFLAVUS_004618 [Mucor flavus]|uniref:Uncharacterized protein n=1 Tax=Mucor flavus TaxID=439312 RepID=A0ABP9YWH7_9FUNG